MRERRALLTVMTALAVGGMSVASCSGDDDPTGPPSGGGNDPAAVAVAGVGVKQAIQQVFGLAAQSGDDLQQELARITALSSNTVQIDAENRQLKQTLAQAGAERKKTIISRVPC